MQHYFRVAGFCAHCQSQAGTEEDQVMCGSLLLCLYIPGVICVKPNGSWMDSGDQIQLSVDIHMHIHKTVLSLNVCISTLEMCVKASKFSMTSSKAMWDEEMD